MLPFRWGLLGVALLIAFTHGASINSATYDDNIEFLDEVQRSKRSYKHGQTQSQYLNMGQNELDGKAEAEATENGSRSTVTGTHGMGQAQSQFSSGDCSGCGSPVYDYSTGSPDPLTLGRNVISYGDGKPSSMIGIPGTTTGGAFGPGTGGVSQGGRPGVRGPYAPGTGGTVGQSGISGGYAPGAGVPGATGTGGLGQIGRPGTGAGYAPGIEFTPGGVGQVGRPGVGGEAYAPGIGGTPGQLGQPGPSSGYAPGAAIPGVPGTGGLGQIGRPGAGAGYAPGTGVAGQEGAPTKSYTPGYGQPIGTGGVQQGPTGTTFGLGSGVPPTGVGKTGIGGNGQQGQRQPQLIAPPAILPGQVQGTLPLVSPKCETKASKNYKVIFV